MSRFGLDGGTYELDAADDEEPQGLVGDVGHVLVTRHGDGIIFHLHDGGVGRGVDATANSNCVTLEGKGSGARLVRDAGWDILQRDCSCGKRETINIRSLSMHATWSLATLLSMRSHLGKW